MAPLDLSHQQATAFLSSIINNSGGNLDEIAVSTSTERRSRATARAEGATSIKDSYTFLIGQINFDGKLLGDLEGSFDKVNRLAVVAVQEEGNQLLCIAKTDDSTGKVEAATVKEALDNWRISDGIIASCFDTTSSNTGIYSGSTVLLQQHLNRQLLWLSCRRHIPALILKAAFQTLFGKTTGPSAALFSCLKTSWKYLDLTDLRLPPTPSFPHSQMPASQYFRDTPGTSQRSASPLLSAILPWRQKPATSLLGRLEDCHLPQSRLESLPCPPSPHLAPCQTS